LARHAIHQPDPLRSIGDLFRMIPYRRQAHSQKLIGPLLAERDPGAKDCVSGNRRTYHYALTPEAYVVFEQLVNHVESDGALKLLKKAARRHGISL
jgi:hypothetical protein